MAMPIFDRSRKMYKIFITLCGVSLVLSVILLIAQNPPVSFGFFLFFIVTMGIAVVIKNIIKDAQETYSDLLQRIAQTNDKDKKVVSKSQI
jgi:hypothetical protein